jgi:hypothetical protein
MQTRQKIYYFNAEQQKTILIESDRQAQEYLNIEWMETYFNYDTQFLPSLLVKKMSPALGFGVFALEDIHKDQLICLYTGSLVTNKIDSKLLREYGVYIKSSTHTIDAANKGNIGRFIQHLPTKEFLMKNVYLYDGNYARVATANAYFDTININNQCYPAVYAKYDIKKLTLIGLSYGQNYWDYHCQVPELFHINDNTIIDHQLYYFINKLHNFDCI